MQISNCFVDLFHPLETRGRFTKRSTTATNIGPSDNTYRTIQIISRQLSFRITDRLNNESLYQIPVFCPSMYVSQNSNQWTSSFGLRTILKIPLKSVNRSLTVCSVNLSVVYLLIFLPVNAQPVKRLKRISDGNIGTLDHSRMFRTV